MIKLHDIEQGTPEWHKARQGKFTGSNAYKLLGSFGAGDWAKAVQEDFKGNFHTKRGHILEDEAIELYEKIKKQSVQTTGFVTNDRLPGCLYSPDGLTETHIIEVKCFSRENHMALWNADSWLAIPKKILAQIHYGMLICEKSGGRLIIYNPELVAEDPKRAFKIIEVPLNLKIQNNFKRILEEAINGTKNTATAR